ncbi:MAG: ubiquinone/menaquinone biosynthesis C-methylase UbiE [Oleiphilaceae bacterium]|jgi:ubiquinone/menaquinone biosynthesis C-methylase UbiE
MHTMQNSTMSIYENYILPQLINFACGTTPVKHLRQKIVPNCYGKVLEIGMGSGLNLPFYNKDKVEFIWGLEPSLGMRKKASKNLLNSNIEVKWLDLPSEEIPLNSNSVDTVLLTFCLCTIHDTQTALVEMHRVLKPEGKLLFCEHGISHEHHITKWQNRITPGWKKISGGCHLNRPIDKMIIEAKFSIDSIERFYQRNIPKTAGFIYLGEARKLDHQKP